MAGVAVVLSLTAARAETWRGYLRLDKLKGESVVAGYEGWLDLQAFSEGVSAEISGGASKSTLLPLGLTRTLDSASVPLTYSASVGDNLGAGTLKLVKGSRTVVEFLVLDLDDVRISKVEVSGTDGGILERLSLSFGSLKFNSVVIRKVTARTALAGPGGAGGVRWGGVAAADRAGSTDGVGSSSDDAPALLGNLLRNPGAEAGLGEAEAWQSSGGFGAVAYTGLPGLGGGDAHGAHLFAAADAGGTGSQVVDVSSVATAIDAGQLQAVLAGWLGGAAGEQEAARLIALFRDATGSPLGRLQMGSGAEDAAGLVRYEQARAIPSGTRAIEVTVEFRGSSTGPAQAYADDLSLVIEQVEAASADIPVEIQVLRASGTVMRSQVQLSWAPHPAGVEIESAERLEGPWRRESGSTRVEGGRERYVVPMEGALPVRFWRVRAASNLR